MKRSNNKKNNHLFWYVRTNDHGWVQPQPVPDNEKNNVTALDLAIAYLKISDSIALSRSHVTDDTALELAHQKMVNKKGH